MRQGTQVGWQWSSGSERQALEVTGRSEEVRVPVRQRGIRKGPDLAPKHQRQTS